MRKFMCILPAITLLITVECCATMVKCDNNLSIDYCVNYCGKVK